MRGAAVRGLIWVSGAVVMLSAFATPMQSAGAGTLAHGLWVWKSPSVLQAPRGAETLRDFCQSNGITEVYVSISSRGGTAEDGHLAESISLLHRSSIRVEALLSSTDADEPGRTRDKLLDNVRGIVRFNEQHPADRFDGIHLDVEPQQRPENNGPGNLRFLADLVDTYHAVRALAEPARLTVNASTAGGGVRRLPGDARNDFGRIAPAPTEAASEPVDPSFDGVPPR